MFHITTLDHKTQAVTSHYFTTYPQDRAGMEIASTPRATRQMNGGTRSELNDSAGEIGAGVSGFRDRHL